MKNLSAFLVTILISLDSRAALIVDTLNDSFIDTTTQLEWIDFGITNNQSYQFVSDNLDEGEIYYGWRLPTSAEVYSMWSNVANLDGLEADYERPDRYGSGQLRGSDKNDNDETQSVFDQVFAKLGYNDVDPYGGGQAFTSYGFFEGNDGLSYVEMENKTLHRGVSDYLLLRDDSNYDSVRNLAYDSYSTLLVKNSNTATDVPEPSSIALFSAAILGLFIIRPKRRRANRPI